MEREVTHNDSNQRVNIIRYCPLSWPCIPRRAGDTSRPRHTRTKQPPSHDVWVRRITVIVTKVLSQPSFLENVGYRQEKQFILDYASPPAALRKRRRLVASERPS